LPCSHAAKQLENRLWARAVNWRKFYDKVSVRCAHRWEFRAAFLTGVYAFCHARKPQLRVGIHRCTSYMNAGISTQDSPPSNQDRTFGPLLNMHNIIFLEPLTPLTSQPRLPGALMSSNASGGSIAPISVPQPPSQFKLRNEIWNPSQKRHSSALRCRDDAVQEQGTCRDFYHNNCV
jgi:hypothetical protein